MASATREIGPDGPDDLDRPERDFARLYGTHFPRLVRFCRQFTSDVHTAEDIAQEALVLAYRKLDRFDPSRPFWPWLRAIARNVAADTLGSRQIPVADQDPPDHRTDLDLVEHRMLLGNAMRRVPPRHRRALGLRYVAGLSVKEATAELGMSTAAFNQLMLRARESLRTEFRRMGAGTLGVLGPACAMLRARLRRAADRLTGRASRDAAWSRFAPEVWVHATSGLAAIVLLLGTSLGPVQARGTDGDDGAPPMVIALAAPKTALGLGGDAGPPRTPPGFAEAAASEETGRGSGPSAIVQGVKDGIPPPADPERNTAPPVPQQAQYEIKHVPGCVAVVCGANNGQLSVDPVDPGDPVGGTVVDRLVDIP